MTLWYTDGPLEAHPVGRKYWSPVTHPQQDYKREYASALNRLRLKNRISLHRTAGQDSTWKTTPPHYNPRAAGLLEHDPRPKGAGKIQQKLNKVRFESRPRKRQRPMPEEDEDPIIVAYSDEDKGDDPIIIVAGLEGDDEQKDQEVEHTREGRTPSVAPGRRERKYALCIYPKITSLTPHLKMRTGTLKVCPSWLI